MQNQQMLPVMPVFSQCYDLKNLENVQPEIVDHAKYIWYSSTPLLSQMGRNMLGKLGRRDGEMFFIEIGGMVSERLGPF